MHVLANNKTKIMNNINKLAAIEILSTFVPLLQFIKRKVPP